MASGQTLITIEPKSHDPQGSGFGTPDVRNNHPVIDLAIGETVVVPILLPRHYGGGGITIYLHYAMSSAVANDIKLETYIERVGDQQQDLDADGFAAAQNTGDITVPGTSGLVDIITSTHTNGAQMDGLAVGEGGRLKVKRVAVVGTDASGDLEIFRIEIKET